MLKTVQEYKMEKKAFFVLTDGASKTKKYINVTEAEGEVLIDT